MLPTLQLAAEDKIIFNISLLIYRQCLKINPIHSADFNDAKSVG